MSSNPARRDPPRVLMVLKRPLGEGGLQIQARRVTASLRARGVPCTLLCHARGDRGHARLQRWPVPVVSLRGGSSLPFHLGVVRTLRQARGKVDVVHVHGHGPEAFSAAIGGRLAGLPVLVKPSTAGPGSGLERWGGAGQQPARRWLLRRGVWRWIAVSERAREELLRAGAPAERVALVPNGVDTERYSPLAAAARERLRAEFGLWPHEVVVAAVARLTAHKRIDLLVRAAASLNRAGHPLRLWVIGRGEEQAALESLARELAPPGMVTFCGWLRRAETIRRLQAADLYVACSRWEGLSNALLEAMACGLAPVSTRVSGAEDLLVDGRNGRLVAVDDEAALAAATGALVADSGARARLGAAARATIECRYSLDCTAEALLALYREATGLQKEIRGCLPPCSASAMSG
jgi:glycosyltransferase involved in cell wall biosynthesis